MPPNKQILLHHIIIIIIAVRRRHQTTITVDRRPQMIGTVSVGYLHVNASMDGGICGGGGREMLLPEALIEFIYHTLFYGDRSRVKMVREMEWMELLLLVLVTFVN